MSTSCPRMWLYGTARPSSEPCLFRLIIGSKVAVDASMPLSSRMADAFSGRTHLRSLALSLSFSCVSACVLCATRRVYTLNRVRTANARCASGSLLC